MVKFITEGNAPAPVYNQNNIVVIDDYYWAKMYRDHSAFKEAWKYLIFNDAETAEAFVANWSNQMESFNDPLGKVPYYVVNVTDSNITKFEAGEAVYADPQNMAY